MRSPHATGHLQVPSHTEAARRRAQAGKEEREKNWEEYYATQGIRKQSVGVAEIKDDDEMGYEELPANGTNLADAIQRGSAAIYSGPTVEYRANGQSTRSSGVQDILSARRTVQVQPKRRRSWRFSMVLP